MKTYDWIVVGAGITGSALAYELAKTGLSVLLLEQHSTLQGATRFGYGGLAFWSGTTDFTARICAEGIAIHRTLTAELESETQFRELDLVLTIAAAADPDQAASAYAEFAIPPQLLDVAAACELEPLLNPRAIAGALVVKHGHIHPGATALAYTQAFKRLGGSVQIEQVTGLVCPHDRVEGVTTPTKVYHAANLAICAGALSRQLLKAAQIPVRLYFTHAELIETPPVDVCLHTLVMPADTRRFQLEEDASTSKNDFLWDIPGSEPVPYILDAGAIQFKDGSFRIGQVSRVLTDPHAPIDAAASEAEMRQQVGDVLPALSDLPGTWHHCLIAFTHDRLPLVGAIPGVAGLHLFSGFSNPLVIVPPLARRFARHQTDKPDADLEQLSPTRFQS